MRRLRRRFRTKNDSCTSITVASIYGGGGATHFSLLIGNYYAKVRKKRTAIVDLGNNNDYDSLCLALGKEKSDVRMDSGRLSVYKKALKTDIEGIFELGYSCVIFDVGSRYLQLKNEVAMCDKRFMMMCASSWKLQETMQGYRDYFIGDKSDKWKYLFSFGDRRSVCYMEEQLAIKMWRMPFIPDPFQVEKKQLEEIERIILEA